MADCLFIVNRKFYSSFALRCQQVQDKKCKMKLTQFNFKTVPPLQLSMKGMPL